MRRAAAAKEAQSSPSESSSHTPKRARLSTEAESPRTSDMDAISAALAAEEEKRREAVARAAEEAGETHWVLDIPAAPQYSPQPLVLAADSLDADDNDYSGGRQAFGNFKRKERKVGILLWIWFIILIYRSHNLPRARKITKTMMTITTKMILS